MEQKKAEELIRRLAAALRGTELYSPTHPLVQRGIDALTAAAVEGLQATPSIVIGFIGDEVVVDGTRLPRGTASLIGFARDLRDRGIEKITLTRGLSRAEVGHLVAAFTDRKSPVPLPDRLLARGVRNVTLGRIVVDEVSDDQAGIAAARRVYGTAVETAETLWNAAKAGDQPDPGAARKIIDGLARLVTQDRTSLMALTALKKYDNYTFTHMVNVSALAMAQARALNIDGPLLREFGFAALMHDIGKVNTPLEVLNKPDKLTKDEFDIMKRHVVDGAHILRRTPEMPALAPIVAFEHHLKQDLSGYPENIGSRKLNLCTMIVSIADVFDALRSNRPYRAGPGDRPHPQHHGRAGQPGVQPGAAQALRQPDGAVSGRQPGAPQHRRARGRHRRAPDRSVPAAGEDHHGRVGRDARRAAARQHLGARRRAASIRMRWSKRSTRSRPTSIR